MHRTLLVVQQVHSLNIIIVEKFLSVHVTMRLQALRQKVLPSSTPNHLFRSFDAQNGKEKWKFKMYDGGGALNKPNHGVGTDPAIGRNGEVYAGNHDGCLYALRGTIPEMKAGEAGDVSGAEAQKEQGSIVKDDEYVVIDGLKLDIKQNGLLQGMVRRARHLAIA